jgi:hypothetical protein
MRKQRTATYDKTNKAIIASADLGAALAALNTATHNMKTVAVNMTDVTGVLGNAAKYLGYASAAFNAISTVRA